MVKPKILSKVKLKTSTKKNVVKNGLINKKTLGAAALGALSITGLIGLNNYKKGNKNLHILLSKFI